MFAKSEVLNDPHVRKQVDYFAKLGQEALSFEEFYGAKNRKTGEIMPFSYYQNSVDVTAGGAALFSTRLTASERQCKQGCGVDGTCSYGITALQGGLMVPILGIGTKYSGLYELDTVKHSYDNNGYHTSFTAKCITRAQGKAECDPCDPCCGPAGRSNATRVQRRGQGWRNLRLPISGEIRG